MNELISVLLFILISSTFSVIGFIIINERMTLMDFIILILLGSFAGVPVFIFSLIIYFYNRKPFNHIIYTKGGGCSEKRNMESINKDIIRLKRRCVENKLFEAAVSLRDIERGIELDKSLIGTKSSRESWVENKKKK